MKAVPAPTFPPAAPTAATLAAMADVLAWPLFVLRRDGGLLHANLAARQLLERGQPLLLTPQQRVAPADTTRRAAFDQALVAAAVGQPAALLRWTGPHGGHTVMLAPLPGVYRGGDGDAHRDAHRGADPCAEPTVLLALGAADGQSVDIRGFAALHGLSEAETRVLERLSLGESSVAAAAALGVKPATVRSQAMTLRRKTGHASVADLLRALAVMPPRVLGGGPPGQGE